MHQDLITGERALRNNAAALGVAGGFEQLPLGAALLAGADVVLLQLPRTLAELEEIADAVARYAAPDAVLLAGGRIKHMSLGMNAVLGRHFDGPAAAGPAEIQGPRRQRSPQPVDRPPPFPVADHNAELDLTV